MLLLVCLAACSTDRLEGMDSSQEEAEQAANNKDELILSIGSEPEDGFDPTLGWGRYGSPLFQSTLLTYNQD